MPTATATQAVAAAALAGLPKAQRESLKAAVEQMNGKAIAMMLCELAPHGSELAGSMAQMSDAFRYKELWELLVAAESIAEEFRFVTR